VNFFRDANLPENVAKVASKELRRLKKMSPQVSLL
jgi:hypothetical protein